MHCRVRSFCLTTRGSLESKGELGEVMLFVAMALQFVSGNLAAVPGFTTVLSPTGASVGCGTTFLNNDWQNGDLDQLCP